MEWVLFVSLLWVVSGNPTAPTPQQALYFPSEERCREAADAIRAEIGAPIDGVQTYGRIVCVHRRR